ncbi:metallophosphoesterase [Labilibaculum sp. K2S]|uniref:metallophosphoesterase n=1 Tax=Labilibaculum sp. K2S TaxID=3056386 RepID=UPI0025A4ADC3|nr:metallophosphoesterase [Labilibaculum sp. K2S]MDM8160819.1 metallophosphoesterase [Labilibaculum sp. K2S]
MYRRVKFYKYVIVLFLAVINLWSFNVEAQEKKNELSSGAFSSYDKVFNGNIQDLNLDDYADGPHFFWLDDKTVKSWYINHEKEGNTIDIREKKIKIKGDSVLVKGQKGDRNEYWLRKGKYPIQSAEYSGVTKLLAIGDVHGEYDVLVELLRNIGVVNENLDWDWGDGHLVFVGDIFDRGDKVTESLYLIKKLQRQANENKGKLHLLLGNHEVMVLMNDSRYVAPKYKNMCQRLMFNYPRFFRVDTELGKWLRSLNSVVKINDLLFVHGGLSPDLVDRGLSLEQINNDIRNSLSADNKMTHEELMRSIYFPENPLWYRGYLMKSRSYSIITNEELNKVLSYYDVNRIFFGHTEVESIRFLHEGKVVAINVPMGYSEIEPQVVLIEDGKYYRCFSDGRRELIE